MFNKNKNPDNRRMNQFYESNNFNPMNNSPMYPNIQFERLQYEIKENRRRINNLTKRITRIESYLRIRDDSDYIDEDKPNKFSF